MLWFLPSLVLGLEDGRVPTLGAAVSLNSVIMGWSDPPGGTVDGRDTA